MTGRRVLGALAVAAVVGALLFLPQQSTAYELRWDVRVLRDGIPPIYDPRLTTPDNINLKPHEMVLAVEINGDARAYPIEPLVSYEIVNDVVGGVPLAITWCPLCYSGLVYERVWDGQTLTLGVQGALYKGAQTWWDHETGSIWSQVFGEALDGPLDGAQLRPVVASLTPWGSWLKQHPTTLVLKQRLSLGAPNSAFHLQSLPKDIWVIGVDIDGAAAGFYFDETARLGVQQAVIGDTPVVAFAEAESRIVRTYEARVDGRELSFDVDGSELTDRETGTRWDGLSGAAVSGPMAGTRLRPVLYFSIWDWALRLHYGKETPIYPIDLVDAT
ncbi:MAG: DUF3179 domain-containing (seleno)protein [Chloroflexota bacterium]|nr:DUF3179 domain-containing (seleno)protein [Chloroflexota bacterium]